MSTSTTSTSSSHSRKWIQFDGAYQAEFGEARLADLNDRLAVLKKSKVDNTNEDVKKDADAHECEFVCLGLGCGKKFTAYISESQPNVRCPFCLVVHLVSTEAKAVYVFLAGKRNVRCVHCQDVATVQFDSDQMSFRCGKCDVTMMLRLRGKSPALSDSAPIIKENTVTSSASLFCCFSRSSASPG